jgi:undecaprenyl-diphosphatase
MLPAALGFFTVFAVVTWAVARRTALTRFDDRVMTAIARRRTKTLDGIAAPLSMLATMEPLIVESLVAFAMLVVTVGGRALVQFAVVAVGSGALSEIVKRLVRRPRPPGPHVIPWIRGHAYPSGDLLTAGAIYTTVALIASSHLPDPTARGVLFAIVGGVLALLGACRVYVGVHHPSDVAGGACLGVGWALLVAACLA